MAAPRKDVNTNTTENEAESIDYKAQAEKLQSELEQFKDMFRQFMENSKLQTIETVAQETPVIKESSYEQEIINPNKMISIQSLFYGGMTLRGINNVPIRFSNFGITRPVTFENLVHICNEHRNLAEQGAFFINDKYAIKGLYLEDAYRKIIDHEKIMSIISLPVEDIKNIINNVTDTIKETIYDVTFEGVLKNLQNVDGYGKYGDRTKIEVISQCIGRDIYSAAQDEFKSK